MGGLDNKLGLCFCDTTKKMMGGVFQIQNRAGEFSQSTIGRAFFLQIQNWTGGVVPNPKFDETGGPQNPELDGRFFPNRNWTKQAGPQIENWTGGVFRNQKLEEAGGARNKKLDETNGTETQQIDETSGAQIRNLDGEVCRCFWGGLLGQGLRYCRFLKRGF